MKLFDSTMTDLSHALDVRLERQNVLAGNIANADTPGFHPIELDFDKAMSEMQAEDAQSAGAAAPVAAQEGHISLGGPAHVVAGAPTPGFGAAASAKPSLDGNAVDLDRTLVQVAENALQYGAATRAVGKKLAILKYVASDGQG